MMPYLLAAGSVILLLALLLIVSVIATVVMMGAFNLLRLIVLLRAGRQIILYRKYP
ncbi:hypothetical protein [Anaerolinea thermophila]|uniref:Uncharacterized protein n=1 Tax=Anaerolinea thermophila (strain DSM 14523 / JCM 11388 / NBRC 100420 / UNI-1) TaxID=926569 RepID=E8MYT2_ANATU|nr:hypothetical protein [Anaerolinea thermophila]BAJ64418.1 hypothetical protein ANT_23920 [Anaerolinea thermophila UNI-1]